MFHCVEIPYVKHSFCGDFIVWRIGYLWENGDVERTLFHIKKKTIFYLKLLQI